MSTTTLKYYKSTLAYQDVARERRIRDMKKRFQTRLSRRRFKQSLQRALHRMHT